jgi:hypothetical protein
VAHVDRFVVDRQRLNIKTIHNHITLLITMLNLALDLGWLERIPRIKKPRVRLISQDYRYLRTVDEIRRFVVAARDLAGCGKIAVGTPELAAPPRFWLGDLSPWAASRQPA